MNFTPLQHTFLEGFKTTLLAERYYLTGGTLLAVRYLHHRRSLDLDFFNNAPVVITELQPVVERIAKKSGFTLSEFRRVADRYEWEIRDEREHTKVEFVFYDFKPLKPRIHWQGILIDTLEDMGANKMMALLERHEPKDIFDLYYLMRKKGWEVNKLVQLLKMKFGLPINPHTFFIEAERALKRLDTVRGLMLINDTVTQDKLFTKIHNFFDQAGSKYLRAYLE